MEINNNDSVDDILNEIRNSELYKNDCNKKDLEKENSSFDDFNEETKDDVRNKDVIDDKKLDKESSVIQELSYSLTQSEAYKCLKKAKIIKTVGARAIVFTVVLILAAAGFFISYFYQKNINNLIFGGISLAIIAIIWIFPTFHLQKLAKMNSNGKVITANVYTNKIVIGKEEESWTIRLDKSNKYKRYDDILMFYTTDEGQFFVIPVRALDKDKKEEILKLIEEGTLAYK